MCKDLILTELLFIDFQLLRAGIGSKLNIGLDYLIVKFVLPKLNTNVKS